MLQGQKLQQAYNDYITNYSLEKGLEAKTIENKKHILGKLLPFETCREYSFFIYKQIS
jgi:hypothetical protein